MMTYSGVEVFPGGFSSPTIGDMAISLARQPRFGGHCRQPWTVAEHSMFASLLAPSMDPIEAHMLFHDAHECVTCDVPSTWKNDQTRAQQAELDQRIYTYLQLPIPTDEQRLEIARYDLIATVAEAYFLGPPGVYQWFKKPYEPYALTLLRNYIEMNSVMRDEESIAMNFYFAADLMLGRHSYRSV